ncbi:MAG: hypothetical protein QW231_04995 [Candidatus Bathyarchaeia archaeon]
MKAKSKVEVRRQFLEAFLSALLEELRKGEESMRPGLHKEGP